MFPSHVHELGAGGRAVVHRLVAAAVLVCGGAAVTLAADDQPRPAITVSEAKGVYSISASFSVPESAALTLAVLTDYAEIPRFMPEVRTSRVLERSEAGLVVEQEATAKFMMFSKRIHLLLEIQHDAAVIRFKDRCGRSFEQYEGSWAIAERDGQTQVTYQLSARPAFDVPEFLLKRLLKRDASQMIRNLQAEIRARAVASR